MNILIAEDEIDIRNLIKLTLSEDGYTIFAANDGLEALAFFNEKPISLAILDVMMPKLDGFNLLRKIRETSNIPVLPLWVCANVGTVHLHDIRLDKKPRFAGAGTADNQ